LSFAQGSRTRLSYITEVTYGTTPAGSFNELPITSHSLGLSKENLTGSDIQSDRVPRVDRHGNQSVSGDLVFDLRANNYDDLLESLMFSTWDASPSSAPDELKVGTTLKSFTFEDYMSDIDQARLYTGCAVSQGTFSFAPNQMVTTTFTLLGKQGTIGGTEKTVTAATVNQPFDNYSGTFQIADFGGSLTEAAIVTSLEFTVNNNLNPTFVIGSDTTPQLEYGRCEVTGTFTAYIEDATLINRFINETESEFDFSVNDPSGSNEYKFYFPKVKINSADTPLENPQSRMVTCSFTALYDDSASGEESNLVIYRPDST